MNRRKLSKNFFENLYFTRINNPVAKQAENNNLINLIINRTESIYTA